MLRCQELEVGIAFGKAIIPSGFNERLFSAMQIENLYDSTRIEVAWMDYSEEAKKPSKSMLAVKKWLKRTGFD